MSDENVVTIDDQLVEAVKDINARLKGLETGAVESREAEINAAVQKAIADHAERTTATRKTEDEVEFQATQAKASYKSFVNSRTAKGSDNEEAQRLNDELLLMSKITQRPVQSLKGFGEFNALMKTLYTSNTGGGEEYIPTLLSNRLAEKVRLELRVAALFDDFVMPSQPFDWPLEGSDSSAYLVGESTSVIVGATVIANSDPGTAKVQFSAVKLGSKTIFSAEVDEDSLIPIMPYVEKKIAQAMANAVEDAIINGDTAGTHQDSDVLSAADHRKAWDGLRKLTNAGAKVALTTFSETNLRSIRGKMGKYGVNPRDLVYIVSPAGYNKFLDLDDVTTLDKYGPQAVVITGELAKFDGIPIMISEFVRENLNVTGVYDGITVNNTQAILARPDQFLIGRRRQLTVQSEKLIEEDQVKVVAHDRLHFRHINETPTASNFVGLGNDVAV